MIRFRSGRRSPPCAGTSRRDALRAGLFGLGAAFAGLRLRASAPVAGGDPLVRNRSAVFLFLAGAPSQFDTFDPKPDGHEGCTSINGHLATPVPGVRLSAYLPKLAQRADRLTVVRSFRPHHPEHNAAHKQLMTADLTVQDGKPIPEPGLGAVYARGAGRRHPSTGLPRHALVPPTTRNSKARVGFNGSFASVVEGCQPAALGSAFAPFELLAPARDAAAGPGKWGGKRDAADANLLLELFRPQAPAAALDARPDLLKQLDRISRLVPIL